MAWSLSVFSLSVFGGALIALVVGVAALRERPDPVATPLAIGLFAVAAWAIPHGIGMGFDELASVVFWERARYLGTVVAPVGYLAVALTYAGYDRWLSRRMYALLAVVPVTTLVLVWTNPLHSLFWASYAISPVDDATILVIEPGPWYWVNLGYIYLLTVISLSVLADVAVRSGRAYRKQALLMFVGGLVPLVTNVAVQVGGVGDPTVDLTTTALAVSGLVFALALFHFDLLEIRPVARQQLVEDLQDGVIVVGPNDRIRDFNPTANRVLDGLGVDLRTEEWFPNTVATDGGEMVVEVDGERRVFQTRSTPLTDGRGRSMGRIVYFNDVTDIVEREQRISVLNRILRHNVRNELNVVAGYLDLARSETESLPEARNHIVVAERSVQRVLDFAEKARRIERTLQTRGENEVVAPGPVVDRVVADARERFPQAAITVESAVPTDAGDDHADLALRVVDERLFEHALTELVENAVVHNDRETPHVTVRVELVGDRVEVSVADDGPGVPPEERAVLTARAETDLEHGSGIGLWLATWTVSLSGGGLTFEERDPRGTVVTLTLPAAKTASQETGDGFA